MINPQPSISKEFLYQKIFGDGEFIAAGYIVLPVGGKKPSKGSKDNAYVNIFLDLENVMLICC